MTGPNAVAAIELAIHRKADILLFESSLISYMLSNFCVGEFVTEEGCVQVLITFKKNLSKSVILELNLLIIKKNNHFSLA